MKNFIFTITVFLMSLLSLPVFAQGDQEPKALGLPGDNLDLYAVLDLFQKSKTIEDFQTSLNSEKQAINNLDLDNDKKIDFIKVVTKKDNDAFTLILQDEVSKTETQDVAVILVSKDKNKKVTIQIVGDETLYGKNYIVEPAPPTVAATPNPAYTGANPVSSTSQVVVVESSPVIVYMYSPVYVPYIPPYYYGFYPPYFHPWAPIYFSAYYHNVYHHHHAYYQNTVIIHNSNNYAHYSNSYKSTSVTVNQYNKSGNYKGTYQGNNYNKPTTLPSNSSTRPVNANTTMNTQAPNRAVNTTPLPSNANKANLPQTPNHQPNVNRPSAKPAVSGARRR